jgi:hypothetical protein
MGTEAKLTLQHWQESVGFTRHLRFPHDPAGVIHNADTRLINRNIKSSKWSMLRFSF